MPAPGRFVVVHNRSRDGYQVAAGLAEAGLLERLVTDFYAPPALARLGGPFARRNHPAIASGGAVSHWPAFALQAAASALRVPLSRVFPHTDSMLARRAAAVARRAHAGLLCYGSYVPPREASAGHPVIDFEYHPHPGATLAILDRDHARFPETAASFASERRAAAAAGVDDAWRRADLVICASTMTRRSLEAAGCDPAMIRVVPYGCSEHAALAPRPPGECRFLFVGQGIQRKGLHHLMRAWQARPRPGATLTLACYAIDPGIAALIDDPRIRVLPRRSPAQLAALYADADVFVMPSLIEGFGLVYLEALARGCHLVGTTNTGLPDLGLSDAAATIIEPGAIAALDAAIDALIARKRASGLDPKAIADEARRWSWADFRRGIAEIATAELAAWDKR